MKKTALIILDGWGHGKKDKSNAIFNAHTPYVNSLYKTALSSELKTHGEHVGLPKGQMGNSEVGHLNIGAGRVVHQSGVKINPLAHSALPDAEANVIRNLMERIDQLENKVIRLQVLLKVAKENPDSQNSIVGESQSLRDKEILDFIGKENGDTK